MRAMRRRRCPAIRIAITIMMWAFFCLSVPVDVEAADFCAYYTKVGPDQGPVDKITGEYTDVVVRLGEGRRFVFCRTSSYLPYWETESGKWYVDEIVPRNGDGSDLRPDKYNRYSYARIIENSPSQVVVHWRYMPDFLDVGFDGVVHEYFTITPDGKAIRTVRRGTEKIDDWNDPLNVTTQLLSLESDGIEETSLTPARLSNKPGEPVTGSPVKTGVVETPSAYWKFDEGMGPNSDVTLETVSGIECPVEGNKSLWRKGVSGTALAFDGYHSKVSMPVSYAPVIGDAFSVEAWVVLDAHPFNWVPLVHQSTWKMNGYYLGVNGPGQVGFLANIGGNWETLTSSDALELHRWTHVEATFDGESGEMRVYIDGELQGTKSVAKTQIWPANAPAVMGLNTAQITPVGREVSRGTKTGITGIEGLIDEVRIYDEVLTAEQIAESYENFAPGEALRDNPDLEPRIPPGMPGEAEKFGAFHTKLKYHELWDNMWRTGDHPDIVVKFDEMPTSVVFWRGPSYGPGWVTEKNYWMADQSVEAGDAVSYAEHMSDKQGRYVHVRLIENTDARAVVHWRYASCNILYGFLKQFGPTGLWVDEYFTIYPDGLAVRKVNQRAMTYRERPPERVSWQDVQFLAQPGMTPDEVMNLQALDLANLAGETAKLDWTDGIPSENPLPSANIELVNFKSDYKVFVIFQDGTYINPWGRRPARYCHFMTWNHWPVSVIPSQGRSSLFPDRLTHSALAAADNAIDHGNMGMYGFTNKPISALLPLAKSWCNPPALTGTVGCTTRGYNKVQRAYVLEAEFASMSFTLNGSGNSPIVNPCFVVKGWGSNDKASLELNGKDVPPGRNFRQGIVRDTDGEQMLVVWIKADSEKPMEVSISEVGG